MSDELDQAFENVVTDLRAAGDPAAAPQMAAYMKDHFEFLGVKSPVRKALQKPLIAASKGADPEVVLDIAERCWAADARELQYVGCDLLRARAGSLHADHLARVKRLITTKSWWDTVDALAPHTVGTLVTNFPALALTMDEWIDDQDFWVARAAILHQLRYKDDVDEARLFAYAVKRAGDKEFFIRKALGWALRSHARVAPEAVRRFVTEHDTELSGLTKREALKHLR